MKSGHNSLSALGAFLPGCGKQYKVTVEGELGHNSLSALGAFLPRRQKQAVGTFLRWSQ